jgi:hypothetical protein
LGGRISEIVLEIREEAQELKQHQVQMEERPAESDKQFEILLAEIRHLIRRGDGSDGGNSNA